MEPGSRRAEDSYPRGDVFLTTAKVFTHIARLKEAVFRGISVGGLVICCCLSVAEFYML